MENSQISCLFYTYGDEIQSGPGIIVTFKQMLHLWIIWHFIVNTIGFEATGKTFSFPTSRVFKQRLIGD
jgi:hypothetical protein